MLESLFEKAVLKVSSVEVAGETVRVREPSYSELETWREITKAKGPEAANATILQACIVGDDGARLTVDEAARLAQCPIRILGPILGRILGLTIEAHAKND